MPRQDRTFVTASELAAACEVDPKSIHNWVDRDQIPGAHRTPGRQIRVPAAQAVAFLKTHGYAVPDEFVRRAGPSTAPSASDLLARAREAVDALRAAYPDLDDLNDASRMLHGLTPETLKEGARDAAASGGP